MRVVRYGGFNIWISEFCDYSIYDVEIPGYGYAVATFNSYEDATNWIDDNQEVLLDA